MIDIPSVTAALMVWAGCHLPICESMIEKASQYRQQQQGVVLIDQRIGIEPGKKLRIDGLDVTLSGYEDCGDLQTAPDDAKRCVVFGQYSSTAMVDLTQADGTSTAELWASRLSGDDVLISRPNGDVIYQLKYKVPRSKLEPVTSSSK